MLRMMLARPISATLAYMGEIISPRLIFPNTIITVGDIRIVAERDRPRGFAFWLGIRKKVTFADASDQIAESP